MAISCVPVADEEDSEPMLLPLLSFVPEMDLLAKPELTRHIMPLPPPIVLVLVLVLVRLVELINS